MICGKCGSKVSDIELYCKSCGVDLQVFSSEKARLKFASEELVEESVKETSDTSPIFFNEVNIPTTETQTPPSPSIDIQSSSISSVPSLDNIQVFNPDEETIPKIDEKKNTTEEKPLFEKFFIDEEK